MGRQPGWCRLCSRGAAGASPRRSTGSGRASGHSRGGPSASAAWRTGSSKSYAGRSRSAWCWPSRRCRPPASSSWGRSARCSWWPPAGPCCLGRRRTWRRWPGVPTTCRPGRRRWRCPWGCTPRTGRWCGRPTSETRWSTWARTRTASCPWAPKWGRRESTHACGDRKCARSWSACRGS